MEYLFVALNSMEHIDNFHWKQTSELEHKWKVYANSI